MTKESTKAPYATITLSVDKPQGHLDMRSTTDLKKTIVFYLDGLKLLLKDLEKEQGEPMSEEFFQELLHPILDEMQADYADTQKDEIKSHRKEDNE